MIEIATTGLGSTLLIATVTGYLITLIIDKDTSEEPDTPRD